MKKMKETVEAGEFSDKKADEIGAWFLEHPDALFYSPNAESQTASHVPETVQNSGADPHQPERSLAQQYQELSNQALEMLGRIRPPF